jgi:hypothetical protein
MTPEGVAEDEARQWVSRMRDLFMTLGVAWRRALDDPLAQAQATVTQSVTRPGEVSG